MNVDPNKQTRFTKLDGLRGLLSVLVALNHSFLIIAIPSFANVWKQNYLEFFDLQSKIQQLFMILGNGGVAVTLFFVLSGMVLSQSLSKFHLSLRNLLAFYLKRLARLYPVYFFVILLIAVYMKLGFSYTVFPQSSSWFQWWMNFSMTLKEFVLNSLLVHLYLGGVTWTLRVIIIASFLFPLIHTISKRTHFIGDVIVVTSLIWSSFHLFNYPDFVDLRYLYMFYLGAILPKYKDYFAKLSPSLLRTLFVILIPLMLVIRYQTDPFRGGVIESLISFVLIGALSFSDTVFFGFLNHSTWQYLGKISYSLYLIHFSVLYILARLMFQIFPATVFGNWYLVTHTTLFVLSLLITIPISHYIHRFVEVPSARIADKIGKNMIK